MSCTSLASLTIVAKPTIRETLQLSPECCQFFPQCTSTSALDSTKMLAEEQSTLLQLAKQVQSLTTQIVNDLSEKNIPEPSFATDSSALPESPEHIDLRVRLNDKARDLLRLINGPKNDARTFVCYLYDLTAWQVACEFNFFEAIPENQSATIEEIAQRTGIDQDRAARFLRMLCSDRVFEETEKDVFRHTSRSILYLHDTQWRDVMHYQYVLEVHRRAACLLIYSGLMSSSRLLRRRRRASSSHPQ